MSDTKILPLPDQAATHTLAQRLAGVARPGDVICLSGTLGMGKSALARAFIRALTDPDEDVPSPTFTLVQIYDADPAQIWHFDLYRLEKPADALELGIEDAFADAISLIEWPDRLGPLAPRDRLDITLSPGPTATARQATLTIPPGWRDRLKEIAP